MKLKIDEYGITEFKAECFTCTWNADINDSGTGTTHKVRNATMRHVKDTGHTVGIRQKNYTEYKPKS